jgi:threonine/homoserine/homoserine lactone efflux protein
MALTPGPNMVYLISRSICQGRTAGLISPSGVALGVTALLLAVPYAYDALRFGGALYLLWLAWQAVKPGGRSPFQVRQLSTDSPSKLFAMGFVTNLLNPKRAVLYLSLLPQFIEPRYGHVFDQSLILGGVQVTLSVTVNSIVAMTAGSIAVILGQRPFWLVVQRWLMGTVLASVAVRMATEALR